MESLKSASPGYDRHPELLPALSFPSNSGAPGCTLQSSSSLENPGIHTQNLSFISHLFALGRWRVKPVVGEIPSEDVQFTGNYPPRIPEIQIILWREKGFKLPGKQDTHRGCWGRPVPQPRQSHVRNLSTKDAVRAHSGVSQRAVMSWF